MRQHEYTMLILIVMLQFTCGERKIWQIIKKSQKIMTMIVWKSFFCFLRLYEQFQRLKTVIFWLEFTVFFYKHNLDQTLKSFTTKFGPQ